MQFIRPYSILMTYNNNNIKNNNNSGPSYLSMSSACATSAAEAVAKRKEEKYIEIACNHHFFPIAFETFGPINQVGHRISTHTDDPRETFFLFQRLFVTIQRFNAGGISVT